VCFARPAVAGGFDPKAKFWGGVGMAAGGVLVMATSHRSGGTLPLGGGQTFQDPGNMMWGQFLTGAVLTGVGGYLIWDGHREMAAQKKSPTTQILISPKAVAIRRTW
jgi:hypothetical protein